MYISIALSVYVYDGWWMGKDGDVWWWDYDSSASRADVAISDGHSATSNEKDFLVLFLSAYDGWWMG